MANSQASQSRNPTATRAITPVRLISFCVLIGLLILATGLFWTTRDAMGSLSFLGKDAGASGTAKALVDLSPWQTAEALAPLAVSEEEIQLAHEAEHLADHEVDQAFAAGLRQAILDAQHRVISQDATVLQQKIAELEKLRRQDQAQVDKLSSAKGAAGAGANQALEVAKAQLGLDSDEFGPGLRRSNRPDSG
jgi:hypothetical protein